MATVQQIIAQVADQVASQNGFTTAETSELQAISLATAQLESGFNPDAVGDDGTSFGLFQLHEGGELGSLSQSEAEDPSTNAGVAIPVIAQTLKAHPNWSPGQIAAAAQRPADQTTYAADINSLYPNYSGGQIPSGTDTASDTSAGGSGSGAAAGTPILTTPVGNITINPQTWSGIGANIAAVVVGAALIGIGIIVAVRPRLEAAASQAAQLAPLAA